MSNSARTRTGVCGVSDIPITSPRSAIPIFRRIAVKCLNLWSRFVSSEFVQRKVLGDIERWIVALIWMVIFVALFSCDARESREKIPDRYEPYHRTLNF